MNHLNLPALSRAAGTIRLPGAKSIYNRMLLLAAPAEGTTEIRDSLDSDDTRVMPEALRALSVVSAIEARVGSSSHLAPPASACLITGHY